MSTKQNVLRALALTVIAVLANGLILFGVLYVREPKNEPQSLLVQEENTEQDVGSTVNLPYLTQLTNGTTTVRTSPTQVFNTSSTAFSTYARISNFGAAPLSCYGENAYPASSTLGINTASPIAGITVGAVSSTKFTGENSVCFGVGAGCVPYIGPVNCISEQQTVIGVSYK
jgi:hypothetical protein